MNRLLATVILSFGLLHSHGLLEAETKLRLSVKPGLQYDPVALHVKPGEKVELLFDNVDEMMHNFLLATPGSRLEMVEAALALGADGPALHYVPESPKVLAYTPVVLPGKKVTITFDAPKEEGKYPYVCTFPGHGFVMFGTLFVAKKRPAEMDELLAKAAKSASQQLVSANSAQAMVHRTFMPNSSPAAIAVSLPGGHSYCWDAGSCRLRYVWRGGFIKKNGSFGRWRTLPTIEGRIYHQEFSFPFQFKGKGKPSKVSFEGYRMVGGLPAFRYEVDGAQVTEFLAKLPGKSGLKRRFTVNDAPSELLFEIDRDAGVEITCDKGKTEDGWLRLTTQEAQDFTLVMKEKAGQSPLLYLSMNDLAVCYNRKGDLHAGAIGQAWRLGGGKPVKPAQIAGDFSQGATLAAWVKLTDPTKPIPAIVGWQNGGAIQYLPGKESYSFGSNAPQAAMEKDGLEAERAKFKGPSRNASHAGHFGDGYLDFGSKVGEYVEWSVQIKESGPHSLRFRYASLGNRPLQLSVDGETDLLAPHLPFKDTGDWTSWKYLTVKKELKAGERLIRLSSVRPQGPNLDRLEIIGPNDKASEKAQVPKDTVSTDQPSIDDDWHLVAVSLNAEKTKVYLDGELMSEGNRKVEESLPEGSVSLSSSARHPQFYLDELRVYERSLPQDEIRRLMNLRPKDDE